MKAKAALLVSVVLGLGTTGVLFAKGKGKGKDKWVCLKDEAEVKVKGKTADEKGKDCETQGGIWEKVEKNKPSDEQSSGNGGGW